MYRSDRHTGFIHCTDSLVTAETVALYECVSCADYLRCGAEILLHKKHSGVFICLFKVGQCVGIGTPERIDALVLIADHKYISAVFRKKPYYLMLYPGSVLRLINAYIAETFLIIIRYIRVFCKYIERCHHLIVIVHQASDRKLTAILLINFKRICTAAVKLRYLLICQHHILGVCDHSTDIIYHRRVGKLSCDIFVYIGYEPLAVTLTTHKPRYILCAVYTAVSFCDLSRQAVYCAYLKAAGILAPERFRKALL